VKPRLDNVLRRSPRFLCDIDCAKNPETRDMITGFIIFWKVDACCCLKSQKSVTLFINEAEKVAISESDNEVNFVSFLLKDIYIKMKLSIILSEDKIGVIFKVLNRLLNFECGHALQISL
jgi:hypothetical protein